MSNNGTVEIHGKTYETVALRVKKFRDAKPNYTLRTEIKRLDDEMVVIEAQIADEQGRLIANGHAQEFRQSSSINRTSYVENCETSAIGRALASFGMGGTEFATADEVANAITMKARHGAERPGDGNGKITPASGMFESLNPDMQNDVLDLAHRVSTLHKRGDIAGAWDEWSLGVKEYDEIAKAAAWAQMESNVRSALKKESDKRKSIKEAA